MYIFKSHVISFLYRKKCHHVNPHIWVFYTSLFDVSVIMFLGTNFITNKNINRHTKKQDKENRCYFMYYLQPLFISFVWRKANKQL